MAYGETQNRRITRDWEGTVGVHVIGQLTTLM